MTLLKPTGVLLRPSVLLTNIWSRKTTDCQGYSTSVIDAHKDGHAAHHAGPLPLELVRLPQAPVDEGVQQPDARCRGQRTHEHMVSMWVGWERNLYYYALVHSSNILLSS